MQVCKLSCAKSLAADKQVCITHYYCQALYRCYHFCKSRNFTLSCPAPSAASAIKNMKYHISILRSAATKQRRQVRHALPPLSPCLTSPLVVVHFTSTAAPGTPFSPRRRTLLENFFDTAHQRIFLTSSLDVLGVHKLNHAPHARLLRCLALAWN